MNDLNTPDQRAAGHAPDELDVLLRDFFQAEMPNPWPTMKAPGSRTTPRPASSPSGTRSRLVLAASVGFLMVGSWAISGRLPEYNAVGIEPMSTTGMKADGKRHFPAPKFQPGTAVPGSNGSPSK